MCVKPRSQNELDCFAKIETLTARIEAGEEISTLYLARAHQYKQVAHLDEAIADLTHSLAIDPPLTVEEMADAYNLRGIAYRRQARFTESIVDATTSIKLMPERASYWADRGWACVCGGLAEQGMADLNHALEMEPYFLALIYRGIAHFTQGHYNAALADYDQVISLYGNNIAYNSFLNRGVLRLMMDFDLAAIEADFDVSVQRIYDSFTPNGRPFAYRALVRAMRGHLPEAEADLHEAEHLGGDPILPLVRGWIGKSNNQPAALRSEIANFVFEICPVIGLSTDRGLQLAARFIENPGSALPSFMPLMVG
jgi:tetratricopeptide (TPR) repeat protein